jgi:hypothetical protein
LEAGQRTVIEKGIGKDGETQVLVAVGIAY